MNASNHYLKLFLDQDVYIKKTCMIVSIWYGRTWLHNEQGGLLVIILISGKKFYSYEYEEWSKLLLIRQFIILECSPSLYELKSLNIRFGHWTALLFVIARFYCIEKCR